MSLRHSRVGAVEALAEAGAVLLWGGAKVFSVLKQLGTESKGAGRWDQPRGPRVGPLALEISENNKTINLNQSRI